MLIHCLEALNILLAVTLAFSIRRNTLLHTNLIATTKELDGVIERLECMTLRVRKELGFESIDAAVTGYSRLCGALGYSLHNWGEEEPLSMELRSYLGGLGNVLRELVRVRTPSYGTGAQGPQVKRRTEGQYSGCIELKWAPEVLQPLLDGLTLRQVIWLTQLLLDGRVELTEAFFRMGICLLTPEGYKRATRYGRN